MTTWHDLDPARPVQGYEPAYVPRRAGGDRLAVLVDYGLTPVAVAGHAGAGKTTEVLRTIAVLPSRWRPMRVDLRRLTEAWTRRHVLHGLAEHLVDRLVDEDASFVPTRGLIDDLRASNPTFARGHGRVRPALELAGVVADEIEEHLDGRRLVLFLDGLDRVRVDDARVALDALAELALRLPLVVVVSPALVYGPDAVETLRAYRVFTVPVRDRAEGAAFLEELLLRRLDLDELPDAARAAVDRALRGCGGLPRTFLALLRDAALYARVEDRELPSVLDVEDALRDHLDSLRRLLVDGDLAVLAAADGTRGLEVPADRRIRLLSHGLLLEVPRGDGVRVVPHPALRPLLDPVWEE